MATLQQLQSRTYDLLRETSSDGHFTSDQITGHLNHAQEFLAALSSPPEDLVSVATQENVGQYTLPSDQLIIKQAFFGDKDTSGQISPLTILNKAIAKEMFPRWLDATSANAGFPTHLWRYDKTTIYIHRRPNADHAGKRIYLFYGFNPTALVNASDEPQIHPQYHNIMPFFACRLAYLALSNGKMATTMYNNFLQDYNLISDNVDKEAEEIFAFKWGISEDATFRQRIQ